MDGRVFVAEKSGRILVFDSLSDTTPSLFANLSTNVYNFWDRGLLGFELDPNFPIAPYVYVLYAYDAAIGGVAPRWGTPGVLSDPCPTPPGATADGCVVAGRVSRLEAAGNVMIGPEKVLIEDWCQQYPSHSVGSIDFGADGALYVSGGDGASFTFTDYGQDGNPLNPCGDPPGGVGAALTPPTAEGGALRSQDLRTSGDPVTLDGAILRVDPATGAGMPDNPLAQSSSANARRIIAHGLRNPFRLTVRPGTNEVWVGDVGWNDWEEIDRVPNPTDSVDNFGWPCYEGNGRQAGYDGANLNICENLYGQPGAVAAPFHTYAHSAKVVTGETCPTGSSSIAGLAFYGGGAYPDDYDGALFFTDYSRDCIWVMRAGANGLPNPSSISTFAAPAANPVDLQVSAGELFYADFDGGTIRRISYTAGNQPPTAVASASPTSGPAPLTVSFDGTGSSDPDPGDTITYAWDLDGDGAYDDSSSARPSRTYSQPGTYTVRLRVADNHGASATSSPITISADNTPPSATLATPAAGTTWKVGDVIGFSGSATDQQDGSLPPSALTWSLILHHCPSTCHTHPLQTWSGVASGSFAAPDHEYPSHLELKLTATDSSGLTDAKSVLLHPQTVDLAFATQPSGLQLAVNGVSRATPFTRTVIAGSNNSVSAPTPQTLGADTYAFSSWSDGGAQTHNVTANAAATYTATYTQASITFSGDADARVQEAKPSSNYGTSYLRTDGGSDPDVETYLRFTVAGVSSIANVKLRLYTSRGTADGPAVYTSANTSWTESGITWSNRPARTTTGVADKGTIGSNTWAEFDVTPLVAGNGTYTFVLASSSTDGVDFNAREVSTATLRPQLVVTGQAAPTQSPPPTADFSATPRSGTPPLAVQFTDTSTGAPTEWAWDFQNDGTVDATVRHPAFTYAAAGTYTVKLTARNANGSDDEVKIGYITVAATGATVTFSPEADARVEEASPSSNYGTSSALRTDGGSDPDVETYLRFTVTGASTVASAKLRVYATSGTIDGPAVYTSTNSWSETGITWSNRPARTTTGVADKGTIGSNTWVEFDVTPLVSGNGTYTFVLAMASTDGVDFYSRQAADAALRPSLVVAP